MIDEHCFRETGDDGSKGLIDIFVIIFPVVEILQVLKRKSIDITVSPPGKIIAYRLLEFDVSQVIVYVFQ